MLLKKSKIFSALAKSAYDIKTNADNALSYSETKLLLSELSSMPFGNCKLLNQFNTLLSLADMALMPMLSSTCTPFKIRNDLPGVIVSFFKIFVVGDDYFRADTVAIGAGDGVFTVDSTYVRAPIWTTASNLGVKRANNYLTFKLDTYKALELGPIIYSLDTVNPIIDGYAYTTLATENKITKNLLRIKNTTGTPVVGNKLCLKDYVTDADATTYNVINVTNVSSTEFILTLSPPLAIGVANNKFIQLGTASTLPLGMQFDQGTAEVFGVVPYQPAITKSYTFTVTATRLSDRGEIANSKRTFSVQVLGEIDSVMTWNTPSNLGSIGANLVSTLAVSASSTVSNSAILYVLESGTLPPGLTLSLDGEIVGKVNQFGGEDAPGILTLDGGGLLLDDGTTTLDKDYAFTIQARDILSYSAISREFTLKWRRS